MAWDPKRWHELLDIDHRTPTEQEEFNQLEQEAMRLDRSFSAEVEAHLLALRRQHDERLKKIDSFIERLGGRHNKQ